MSLTSAPPTPSRFPGASPPLMQATSEPSSAADTQPNKSQKQMSKAERRELQEKQRAAKAAKSAPEQAGPSNRSGQAGPSGASRQAGASSVSASVRGGNARGQGQPLAPPSPARRGSQGRGRARSVMGVSVSGGVRSADVAASDVTVAQSRGLRIFSHFALQKPTAHVAKGDVHPAIVRLGLMFSEFKISGANARCIATLSAFKQVTFVILENSCVD
jgi:translation initiation factor eIF-2B subunit delta